MNNPQSMIYQRTMKEQVAKLYGKPFDYFYHWPYAKWQPIQEAFYYNRTLPDLTELNKMNNNNKHPWPIGSLSSDTHDITDLCIRFIDHSEYLISNVTIDVDKLDSFERAINQAKVDLKSGTYEEIAESVDCLMSEFDSLSPEGYYFGAHPDDGACFGYWEVEDEN